MSLHIAAMCLLAFLIPRALAVVGPRLGGCAVAEHLGMVLSRSDARAGFCTGLVLTRTILLTAAHCVSNASDSRVYLPRRRLLPIRPDREVSRLSR